MYYLIISAATVLFGLGFLCNKKYEQSAGNTLKALCVFNIGCSFVGLIALLIINKFTFETTTFTVILASIAALSDMLYCFCAIRSLGKINLSMFSVFAMLGGMALPFAQGILFYGEELTLGKILCFVFIFISLLLTIRKDEKIKSGIPYYIGVFILNGMSGVYSKFFAEADYSKTSEAGYSMWIAVMGVILPSLILPFVRKEKLVLKPVSYGAIGLYGVLMKTANLLLLIALAHIPASAQYPMVTGGVMISSTLLCFFTDNKPSKRDILSVIIAFAGIMLLVLV